MEHHELSTDQLQQFLPHLTTVSNEWRVSPEFIAQLVNDYFSLRKKQHALYQLVEGFSESEDYLLNLAISKIQRQQPILDPQKAYLFSSRLKEGITRESFKKAYEDYQIAQAQAFLNCYQLGEAILEQFFSLEIDKKKYPALAREREQLRRKYQDPNYQKSEWQTPEEMEKGMDQILSANDELEKLSQEKNLHLSFHLIVSALNIHQVQQNIELLKKARINEAAFLLTTDDAQRLMHPISNVNERIHNFISEVLYCCGGKGGVMWDLEALYGFHPG
jgi:hypothetical protein